MCWCTATDSAFRLETPWCHFEPGLHCRTARVCPAVAGQTGRINRCGKDRMPTRVLECAVTPRRLPTGKVQTQTAHPARGRMRLSCPVSLTYRPDERTCPGAYFVPKKIFYKKMSRVSSAQRRKASSLRLSVAEVSRQRPGWGAAPKVATVTRTAADGGGVWSFGARDWARWETRVHVAPRARSGSSQTQAAVLFKGKCLCIFT